MRALAGASARNPAATSIVAGVGLLAVTVVSGHGANVMAPLLAAVSILAVGHRAIFRWDRLIALILVVVLFVPIGRYELPASLPFNLELYRAVVAIVLLLWATSLLIDPSLGIRSTAFDRPLLLIASCVLASEVTNPDRLASYSSHALKALTFFLSFVLVYYLTATTLRGRRSVMFLLKLLTLGGSSIGIFAVVERRTHYNVFDHLHTVLPFLTFHGGLDYLTLNGSLRVFGPSQQPIALGAALVLILPLAVLLARSSSRKWWLAALPLVVGAMASGSRTAVVMLGVEGLVFLFLKPIETKKLWPLLLPALVAVHFALPGTIGALKDSFFPKGGLIAQQSRFAPDYNPLLAGGRIRLIGPMLDEAIQKPFFGEGYGTRITGFDSPDRNAPILDDQWLNNVLDVGFIGLGAWAWLVIRAIRTLSRASRATNQEGDDWLFAGLAASVAAFSVGMFTFDAFDFTQVAFIFWILLGLSAAVLRITRMAPVPRAARYGRADSAAAAGHPFG